MVQFKRIMIAVITSSWAVYRSNPTSIQAHALLAFDGAPRCAANFSAKVIALRTRRFVAPFEIVENVRRRHRVDVDLAPVDAAPLFGMQKFERLDDGLDGARLLRFVLCESS